MQLRYQYRVYPSAGQREALARAFGCARVVFNDALAARRGAREAGLPYPGAAAMTAAKRTPERCWLGGVSAVVLQQSLRDLEAAYRAFFDGLAGKRPRMGAPKFKSRKDRRQAIRFTANARWNITPGGKLALPKIGDVGSHGSARTHNGCGTGRIPDLHFRPGSASTSRGDLEPVTGGTRWTRRARPCP